MMPLVQTLECATRYVDTVSTGDIVRAGTSGAIWRVRDMEPSDDNTRLTLDPVDPHDVPLPERIVELPLPREAT